MDTGRPETPLNLAFNKIFKPFIEEWGLDENAREHLFSMFMAGAHVIDLCHCISREKGRAAAQELDDFARRHNLPAPNRKSFVGWTTQME